MSVAPGTNVIRYAGDLSNPFWAKHNMAVAPVSIGSPTGPSLSGGTLESSCNIEAIPTW